MRVRVATSPSISMMILSSSISLGISKMMKSHRSAMAMQVKMQRLMEYRMVTSQAATPTARKQCRLLGMPHLNLSYVFCKGSPPLCHPSVTSMPPLVILTWYPTCQPPRITSTSSPVTPRHLHTSPLVTLTCQSITPTCHSPPLAPRCHCHVTHATLASSPLTFPNMPLGN